jgi:hypothetical protein
MQRTEAFLGIHPVRFVDDIYNFCTQYIKVCFSVPRIHVHSAKETPPESAYVQHIKGAHAPRAFSRIFVVLFESKKKECVSQPAMHKVKTGSCMLIHIYIILATQGTI